MTNRATAGSEHRPVITDAIGLPRDTAGTVLNEFVRSEARRLGVYEHGIRMSKFYLAVGVAFAEAGIAHLDILTLCATEAVFYATNGDAGQAPVVAARIAAAVAAAANLSTLSTAAA